MYCGTFDLGITRMKESAQAVVASGHRHLQFATFPGIGHNDLLEELVAPKQLENFWHSLDLLRQNSTTHEEVLQLEPPPPRSPYQEQTSHKQNNEL